MHAYIGELAPSNKPSPTQERGDFENGAHVEGGTGHRTRVAWSDDEVGGSSVPTPVSGESVPIGVEKTGQDETIGDGHGNSDQSRAWTGGLGPPTTAPICGTRTDRRSYAATVADSFLDGDSQYPVATERGAQGKGPRVGSSPIAGAFSCDVVARSRNLGSAYEPHLLVSAGSGPVGAATE
uniref:Uncharacterized protein n=1 Tax=Peronospora matthiolae TaxID=2874970 RepID=A0AAV1THX9_9STRA